eukprot:scaffold7349_cov173-Amphora_coffeaeformis.AAC.88
MDSYQRSLPPIPGMANVYAPGVSVHCDDEPVVVEGRFRGNHVVALKKALKGSVGFLLLCAAFMAVESSSNSSRMAGFDGKMLEAKASSNKHESTRDENGDSPPQPEHFDWEKIESKGQYDWQKCKNSSDPDCWKNEGQRVHSYWENFGLKMKSYWSSFGTTMHNFWADFGRSKKPHHTVEATLSPVASPVVVTTVSPTIALLNPETSTAIPPEDVKPKKPKTDE